MAENWELIVNIPNLENEAGKDESSWDPNQIQKLTPVTLTPSSLRAL